MTEVVPGVVRDVVAELASKNSADVSWKIPESGGKVTGYKVMYEEEIVEVPENVRLM